MSGRIVYLDNNATTFMSADCKKELMSWSAVGNPSASYKTAKSARLMMNALRAEIGKVCKIETCCAEKRDTDGEIEPMLNSAGERYNVIFTSGASEGNATILRAITESYEIHKKRKGHVVMASIEHRSLLDMAEYLRDIGKIDLTLVVATASGHVLPDDVARAFRKNTCLVCVMHANNESGAINDIKTIGELAHTANIPVHCDVVQTFGKLPLNPLECNVDSFCISFHKLYGPTGCGALVVRDKLTIGYKLPPLIFGSQNMGMRGGTENVMGLGASLMAMRCVFANRADKNKRLQLMKKQFMHDLSQLYPARSYLDYIADSRTTGPPLEIIFLCGLGGDYLPNTILFSVVKRTGAPMCNSKMKNDLEQMGIIVSVGSACNTKSDKASHVLYAMGADELIRRGALRVSLADYNQPKEVDICVAAIGKLIKLLK